MLIQNGPLSIHEILERYNTSWHHGLTMQQLTNILSGDPRFEKTDDLVMVVSVLGNKYQSTVWRAAV